jgi:hypothetical protein
MGKAGIHKMIRDWAKDLPIAQKPVMNTTKHFGKELIDAGVTEVAGKPVKAAVQYSHTGKIQIPVNHEREMKRIYNDHGLPGVKRYKAEIEKLATLDKSITQKP